VNAQIVWKHGDFFTTLFGSNLTDQNYVGAVNSGLRFAGAPMFYGLRVTKAF
jgi:iron complex outermembrane receptor protein